MPRICIIPKATNTGGVTTFQAKLAAGLASRGIQTCFDLTDTPYEAVLLTGAVRDVIRLRRACRNGIRIVQRLDGINWLHRRLPTGLRHFLKAEYGNCLLAFLRSRIATSVVYQSEFVRGWWQKRFGREHIPSGVIYNGVDLSVFTPDGPNELPADRFRLLMVEGSLQGGYENGLVMAAGLAGILSGTIQVELIVAGKTSPEVQAAYATRNNFPIHWLGLVQYEQIPSLDRSAHLLFSADLNAACPNSVIEALACGLPVVGFSTGALPEMITGNSGMLAPYGGNPWKLEKPDLPALENVALLVLGKQEFYRKCARKRAQEAFALDKMVDLYLDILLG